MKRNEKRLPAGAALKMHAAAANVPQSSDARFL
jgi:hypothetical protein